MGFARHHNGLLRLTLAKLVLKLIMMRGVDKVRAGALCFTAPWSLWLVHGLSVTASHILMLISFVRTSTLSSAIVETYTSTHVHFVMLRFATIHARLHAYKLHCVSVGFADGMLSFQMILTIMARTAKIGPRPPRKPTGQIYL